MTIRNLDRLLEPRSVVLVGASRTAGSVGAALLRNLARRRLRGPASWRSTPSPHADFGVPTYPTSRACPRRRTSR